MHMKRTTRTIGIAAGIAVALAAGLVGCSTSSGESGKTGTLSIPLVFDKTGVSSALNGPTLQAWDLRIKEANASGELGGLTLETNLMDSQSDPKVGAGLMTEVASSDAPIAAFGTTSSVAVAVAPIVQDAGLPTVFGYSGASGLTDTGDMIFRVTAPQSTYHQLATDYFAQQGVKKIDIIYNNDNATLKGLAEQFYPAQAKEAGYEIVRSVGVSYAATDISAEMTGIISDNVDAVVMLVLSQQNASVITQLNRAGYTGIISAQPGIGRQALESLGATADGVIYPIDFSSSTTEESGVAFVKAFQAEYGKKPDTFAAAGYDMASMVVEAIKKAPELTREALQAALVDITNAGMTGAVGPITFENRDARVEGILVRWHNGDEMPAT
jgi:branched-chain amino acid transport system substrate-binding protein